MKQRRKPVLSGPTEKQFMAQVIRLARLYSWLVYHTHDSRYSASGFPDLVLLKDERLIVAELKTDRGKLTMGQEIWLAAFRAAGVSAYLWRPENWDEIVAILTGPDGATRQGV